MLYKVGVLHDRGSLPFSITNNKNAHSENSLNGWSEALSNGDMPFLVTKNDDRFSGISVDMWKKVAKEMDIHYRFIDAGVEINEAIEKLGNGDYHVLVGYFDDSLSVPKTVVKSVPYYLTYNAGGYMEDHLAVIINNLMKLILFLLIFYLLSTLLHFVLLKDKSFKKAFLVTISSVFTLKNGTSPGEYYFKLFNVIVTLILIGYFISRITNMSKGEPDLVKNAEHLSYLSNTDMEYSNLNIENSTWKSAIFLLNKETHLKGDVDRTIMYFRGRKKGDEVEKLSDKYVGKTHGFGAF